MCVKLPTPPLPSSTSSTRGTELQNSWRNRQGRQPLVSGQGHHRTSFSQAPGWVFSQYINVSGEGNLSTDTPLAAAPSDGSKPIKMATNGDTKMEKTFQQYGSGYNPDAAYGGGPQNSETQATTRSTVKGLRQVFEAGYNGNAYDATPPG